MNRTGGDIVFENESDRFIETAVLKPFTDGKTISAAESVKLLKKVNRLNKRITVLEGALKRITASKSPLRPDAANLFIGIARQAINDADKL